MRMMYFVDGENLVLRYQDMLEKENREKNINCTIDYIKDVFVWSNNITVYDSDALIFRITYYTSAKAADETIKQYLDTIRQIRFVQRYQKENHLGTLNPMMFKRISKTRKAKKVDVRLTIDVLNASLDNSLDIIHIISGDGDYIPLIEDVMRRGKRVYVSALSSGLSEELKWVPDKFTLLDDYFFMPKAVLL